MKIGCLHLEGNFIKMYLSLSVSQVMYELSRSLHDDQKAAHLMNHLVQVTCCFQWNIRLPGIQCYFTKYSAPTTGVTDFSNRIVRWATTNCANLSTSKVVIVFHKLLSNISLNHECYKRTGPFCAPDSAPFCNRPSIHYQRVIEWIFFYICWPRRTANWIKIYFA